MTGALAILAIPASFISKPVFNNATRSFDNGAGHQAPEKGDDQMQLSFQTPVNSDLIVQTNILWENPNPTVALSPVVVTLTDSITNYHDLTIEYKRGIGSTVALYATAMPIIGKYNLETTTGNKFADRDYEFIDNTHVQFSVGRIYDTYGAQASTNNGYVIITKIYGKRIDAHISPIATGIGFGTWNILGSTAGKSPITLPQTFAEIYVETGEKGTNIMSSFFIPHIALSNVTKRYRSTFYADSTNYALIEINCNISECWLGIYNKQQTDIAASCETRVWYR